MLKNQNEVNAEISTENIFVSDFDELSKISSGMQNVTYAPFMKLAAQIALAREFSIIASSASRGDSIATLAEAGINTLYNQDLHTTIAAYIERFKNMEQGNLSDAFEDSDDEYEQSTNDPSYQMYPDSEESFLKMLTADTIDEEEDEAEAESKLLTSPDDPAEEEDDLPDEETDDEDEELDSDH